MTIKVLSYYLKITIITLVLAGVYSCSNDEEGYVVPTARFVVSGTLVEDNPEAEDIYLSGIKVSLGIPYEDKGNKGILYLDSLTTKEDGRFILSIIEYPQPQKFVLKIENVDVGGNGSFETIFQDVDFINPSFNNGNGGWFAGDTERNLGLIKINILRPIQPDPEKEKQ